VAESVRVALRIVSNEAVASRNDTQWDAVTWAQIRLKVPKALALRAVIQQLAAYKARDCEAPHVHRDHGADRLQERDATSRAC
jgi:hypothetical protein